MFFTLDNQIFLQSFTFESKKQHIVINSLSLIPQPGAGDISKVIREVSLDSRWWLITILCDRCDR